MRSKAGRVGWADLLRQRTLEDHGGFALRQRGGLRLENTVITGGRAHFFEESSPLCKRM